MGISCDFIQFTFQNNQMIYGCQIEGKQTAENRDIELTAKHVNRKGNKDVIHVQFDNCTVVKIPQGLTKLFPNLKSLAICNSKLKKISKSDLEEYQNLEKFFCQSNEFEHLPGDLFEGFRNLEYISFLKNNLKIVEPNVLDGLNKLKHVDFSGNPNYDNCYSIYPFNDPNVSLQELKADLYDKFYMRFQFLDDSKKSKQNLQQQVQQLTQDKNKLVQQNQKMNGSEKENENLKPKSSLTADIIAFIKDDTTKDFQIQIDDREFPAHKFLLAARSPTLAEILKNNPEVENLNLVDISVEIFEIILKFLYTDELPGDDGTNFLQLFAAAGKLKIEDLKNFAAAKLISQIDHENALEVYKLSHKYEDNELRQQAFKEVKKNYSKVDLKDEWAAGPEKVLKIIDMYNKKEEAMKKIEEEFKNSVIKEFED